MLCNEVMHKGIGKGNRDMHETELAEESANDEKMNNLYPA